MPVRCDVIGLGIMGRALAQNLAPNGLPVVVYDLDEVPVRELVGGGAKAASGPREVARNVDVIGVCVPSTCAPCRSARRACSRTPRGVGMPETGLVSPLLARIYDVQDEKLR